MQSARKQRIGGSGRCALLSKEQLIGAKFLQSHRDQNKDCARNQADQPQATAIPCAVPHITTVEEHIGSADRIVHFKKRQPRVGVFLLNRPFLDQ